jgi:hypothetical protein
MAAVMNAATDKEATDAAAAKKVAHDAMAVAAKVTADKEVVDVAAAKKATDNAGLRKGVSEETTGGPRGLLRRPVHLCPPNGHFGALGGLGMSSIP